MYAEAQQKDREGVPANYVSPCLRKTLFCSGYAYTLTMKERELFAGVRDPPGGWDRQKDLLLASPGDAVLAAVCT